MRKRSLSLLIFIFICVFILQGFTWKDLVPDFLSGKQDTIKIGAVIPLTGKSAALGNYHKQGIDLAVKETNEQNGINGKKIEVVYEDSRNEGKTGIAAYRKLVDIHKVPVLISTFSGVCVPIASTIKSTNNTNAVFLGTATSAPNITIGSEYVFRSFIISSVESREIAKFVAEQLKLNRIAVYCVEDDYGLGAADVFEEEFQNKYKQKLVFKDSFGITQTDHKNTVIKIKNSKPDAIFLTGYGQSLVAAIKQIREADIHCEIICTATLALPNVFNNLGDAKEGIYLTSSLYDETSDLPEYKNFKELYTKIYPDSNANYQTASTYLCLKLIAKAIENGGYTASGIKNALMKIKDFPTPLGKVSFNENREASFPVKIKKIKNGKIVNIL